MFAIVDIETTGGNAENDKITEIAIVIYDGEKVVETYCSLVNPERSIPFYITQLTGISNDMVESAPPFYAIAKKVLELLDNCTFVAHNVRFDYNFIKNEFKSLGFNFQKKTLCTVKLSRKVFKGLPSYSLGKLCDSLGIQLKNRHRALGDAEATAILFDKIHKTLRETDSNWHSDEIKKTPIPPLLDFNVIEQIPEQTTGVYYFYDQNGSIIYIGKSIDIKKRIVQHFAIGNTGSRRGLQMKNEIASVGYECTGNELVALLLESNEIKTHKPIYNIQQKKIRAIPCWGIYSEMDGMGYVNLSIKPFTDEVDLITTAESSLKARAILYQMVEKHQLCLSKTDLNGIKGPCFNAQIKKCGGACTQIEAPESYNLRAVECCNYLNFSNESFVLIGKGRTQKEASVVQIEEGFYKGFGYISTEFLQGSVLQLLEAIKPHPHNRDIQQILCSSATKAMKKLKYNKSQISEGNW